MNKQVQNSVEDELREVLEPFISWRGVPSQKDCMAAKEAILKVLDIVKANPPTTCYDMSGLRYLEGLQHIYFPLLKGNYPDACDKISDYIYCHWERKSHDAFVLLLEEVAAGNL